jgi:hypothetical protein
MQLRIMKMLLASNDLSMVQPVAKRLVAWGIPIALQKAADLSSYLEVWIQRDSDFPLARALLPTMALSPATPQSAPRPIGAGDSQRCGGDVRTVSMATSRTGRWLHRLRRWWQT